MLLSLLLLLLPLVLKWHKQLIIIIKTKTLLSKNSRNGGNSWGQVGLLTKLLGGEVLLEPSTCK